MISTCRRGSNSTCRTGAYKLRTRASMCSFMYLCNVNTKSNQKKMTGRPFNHAPGRHRCPIPCVSLQQLGGVGAQQLKKQIDRAHTPRVDRHTAGFLRPESSNENL